MHATALFFWKFSSFHHKEAPVILHFPKIVHAGDMYDMYDKIKQKTETFLP